MKAGNEFTEIDLGHSRFVKRSDGIVQAYGKEHTYSPDELKEALECMKVICAEKKYPFIFVAHKDSMFDSAALKFFSTRGLLSFTGPRAYVIKSRSQRMLAAIFVNERNNASPAKAFGNEADAVTWLKSKMN